LAGVGDGSVGWLFSGRRGQFQCHLDKESPCPKNLKIIFQYIKSEEKIPLIFLLFFKKSLTIAPKNAAAPRE